MRTSYEFPKVTSGQGVFLGKPWGVSPHLVPQFLSAFRRSQSLQRLADEAEDLAGRIKGERRRVVPVAEVARWFKVSTRQMWDWIEQGWIRKPVKSPSLLMLRRTGALQGADRG